METKEVERRKNLTLIAAAGEWDGIMTNLFERYLTTPQQENQQRLGRIIERNLSEIKKEIPKVAEYYNNIFQGLC